MYKTLILLQDYSVSVLNDFSFYFLLKKENIYIIARTYDQNKTKTIFFNIFYDKFRFMK